MLVPFLIARYTLMLVLQIGYSYCVSMQLTLLGTSAVFLKPSKDNSHFLQVSLPSVVSYLHQVLEYPF